MHASEIEGQAAPHVQKLDISAIDPGIYPDEENVAEACRRLSTRSGFSKEKALAEIAQRTRKPSNKKPVKPTPKPATLRNDHDPHPLQPTQPISQSGTASDKTTSSGAIPSVRPKDEFWEPKANGTADDSPNAA